MEGRKKLMERIQQLDKNQQLFCFVTLFPGEVKLAEECLESGADSNYLEDGLPSNALICQAAMRADFAIIKLLIQYGANNFSETISEIDAIFQSGYFNLNVETSQDKFENALEVIILLLKEGVSPITTRASFWNFLQLIDQRRASEVLALECENSKKIFPQCQFDRLIDWDIRFECKGAGKYVERLQTVLNYSSNPPDEIMRQRDRYQPLTPQHIEILSDQINHKKRNNYCNFPFFKSAAIEISKFSIGFTCGFVSNSILRLAGSTWSALELWNENKSFAIGFLLGCSSSFLTFSKEIAEEPNIQRRP